MLKIIVVIAIVIAVPVAALLIFAATKPDTFRIERSTSVDAPPEKIFSLIDDFHRWSSWSPYELKDPGMKRSFSGAANGKGAVYGWHGDRNIGQGRMEIAESTPPSKIVINLDFMKPFEAHNIAEFTMEPEGNGTKVTWAMYGPSPYFSKVMTTLFSMDRMVGDDFESGLAKLKALAEA